jgi:hypothetical protein
MRFRTIGRFRVRVIRASYFGSKSIFRVFAAAHERKVPDVRNKSVSVDVDNVEVKSGVALLDRISGIGYNEYADVVVRRIRKESRGLVSARYVANLRRIVADEGSSVAFVVSCDDASSGKDSFVFTVEDCSASSSVRLFLLRCGRIF